MPCPFQACAGENPKGGERDDGPVPQVQQSFALPETAPENPWLEDDISFWDGVFSMCLVYLNLTGPAKKSPWCLAVEPTAAIR